jgi:3-phenylpropionate/trans-cinnamate dioxygenase ferredoxin component
VSIGLPDGTQVCVVRVGERVFALADQCSHQAMPLSAGYVVPGDAQTPQLECAWHGARFDCATGRAVRGPAEDAVATYDVSVIDGRVLIGKRRSPATD